MKKFTAFATTVFGLEAIVRRECEDLGLEGIETENGRVRFEADARDIALANIWLRSAERVQILVGSFPATTFDELFRGVEALPWEDYLPEHAAFPVNGKCVRSQLMSVPDAQAITKKAIVKRLQRTYVREHFTERGASYPILISIREDVAEVLLDTTGTSLHKRGYRVQNVDAPLKETMANALIDLSFWNPDRPFADLFCGSGTIPIEAALRARNIAPGLERDFLAMDWEIVGPEVFKEVRREALGKIDQEVHLEILASDIDPKAISIAKANADNAGVLDDILFLTRDFRQIRLKNNFGVWISNPPYGQRLGEKEQVREIARGIGQRMQELSTWSVYILTADENFEREVRREADRRRKLYNGRIETQYYQFHGPNPDLRGL